MVRTRPLALILGMHSWHVYLDCFYGGGQNLAVAVQQSAIHVQS